MIERIDDLPDGVLGMRAVGTMSVEDYVATVEPEVRRIEGSAGSLRLLLHLGPDFAGFGDGAWGDLTRQLRSTRFDRGAVVTDDGTVRAGVTLLRLTLRGRVRSFRNQDYAEAARWVAA